MQLGQLEDDNILMEEQQASHSSDENTVTVELLDIEEALRFDKLDVTLLKQVPVESTLRISPKLLTSSTTSSDFTPQPAPLSSPS